MNKDLNKIYWNKVGKTYDDSWKSKAKQEMSGREISFINRYLLQTDCRKVLDIGIGSGRILKNYTQIQKIREIYGTDIAEKMIEYCTDKFKSSKIRSLKINDISREKIPYKFKFDFISAIRILKYTSNWKEVMGKISKLLADEGICVFSVLNNYSINRFVKSKNPISRSSVGEIIKVCSKSNLEVLEVTSFTVIPDVFYDITDNQIYVKLLLFVEDILRLIGFSKLFGRIIFVAARGKISYDEK